MNHQNKTKSDLHYTRDTKSKRVTSGGSISAVWAWAWAHNSEETSQRWRAVGDSVFDFTHTSFIIAAINT